MDASSKLHGRGGVLAGSFFSAGVQHRIRGSSIFRQRTHDRDTCVSTPTKPGMALPSNADGARTLAQPTSISIGGVNYPALTYFSVANYNTALLKDTAPAVNNIPPNNAAYTPSYVETALAASATGNGIADSFLWRLPMSSIDGVTYYAAARIIDNNSAINVNTANSQMGDFDWKGLYLNPTVPPSVGCYVGLFPGGIGLAELGIGFSDPGGVITDDISLSAELKTLNQFRCSPAYPSPANQRPFGIVGDPITFPSDDFGGLRTDMKYLSVDDALWHALGRRLSKPGFFGINGQFQALPWNDSASLAYKGELVNPNLPPCQTEDILVNSTYCSNGTPTRGYQALPANPGYYQRTPYAPNQVSTWYNNYYNDGTAICRRPYFTTPQPNQQFIARPNLRSHRF